MRGRTMKRQTLNTLLVNKSNSNLLDFVVPKELVNLILEFAQDPID